MSTSTSKLAGSKAREAFIEKNMDPKLYQRQKEVAEEFISEMKQRGYSLQTGDFRQALRDAGIRSRWIREQIAKGKLELGLKEEAIRMDEAEAMDYSKSITAMEQDIAAWEVKEEDALDEDAMLIKEMIKDRPRLAAEVLKDRKLERMIEKGLEEFKKDLASYEQRFDELEDKFQRAAMAKVDALKLPDKLRQRATRFEELISVTIAERDTLGENLIEAHRQLDKAKEEHATAVEIRKSQVQMVVKQNEKLKGDLSAATNQVKSLDRDVESLNRQIQDLQATGSRLQGAAHQASSDISKLGEEKEDLVAEVAALKQRLDQTNRDHAAAIRATREEKAAADQNHAAALKHLQDAQTETNKRHAAAMKTAQDELATVKVGHDVATRSAQDILSKTKMEHAIAIKAVQDELATANVEHTAAIKAVRGELAMVKSDHAVAIAAVKADLASSKELLDNLRSENTDIQIGYLDKVARIESLEYQLQSCKDDLSKTHQESQDKIRGLDAALRERDETLQGQLQEHSTAVDKLSKDKANVEQELASCQAAVVALRSDLQSREEALQQERQEHSTAMDSLSKEKVDVQQELVSCRNTVGTLESDIQSRDKALEEQSQNHSTVVDMLSKEKASIQEELQNSQDALLESIKEHRTAIDRLLEEKSKLESDWQARYATLEKLKEEKEKELSNLSKAKSQMEAEINRRNNDLDKSLKDSRSEISQMTCQLDGLKFQRQASRNMIWATISETVPLETVDGLVDLLGQFLSQHGEKVSNVESFSRCMPRMIFDDESGPEYTPLLHAIGFNLTIRRAKAPFQDSQALFNAPIIAVDYLAYPFILDGLQVVAARVEEMNRPFEPINFRMILTMIQGIAYLGYLVQAMQIPTTDVELLSASVGAIVSRKFKGSILESVFNQSLPALAGQDIRTWLGDSNSIGSNARLDQTNSAIGAGMCIVGDTASLQNFVLLDKIEEDEVLYAFGKEGIKAVAMGNDGVQLILDEAVIPIQIHGRMMLTTENDSLPEHLGLWLALFSLSDKLTSS